jgi:trimethylamine:corrinoid methyltransferase-like protein
MPDIGEGLEEYLARRRRYHASAMAEWERDEAFVALAMTQWSADMEASALGRSSNRSRMRLRYEGYKLLSNAKQQVEALQRAANQALENWGIEVQEE